MLEMLFGKKGPEFKERIWISSDAKMKDLVQGVSGCMQRGVHSVVVTHFSFAFRRVLWNKASGVPNVRRFPGVRIWQDSIGREGCS